MIRPARSFTPGDAEGPALVLTRPVSFWGGIEAATGRVIDRAHPNLGDCVTGAILVMPSGRGSSSSSAVLAEMMRTGTAPAGIVLGTPDPILTVGAIVAEALYGIRCPIVVCPIEGLVTGQRVRVRAVDAVLAQVAIGPG